MVSESESNEKDNAGSSLLWDCFVNWATTLEKLEERQEAER